MRLTITGYDHQISARLKENATRIAVLMRWWWSVLEDEEIWASQIVQKAKISFRKPDNWYSQVILNPKLLGNAIRYQVLLSFLEELEYTELILKEERNENMEKWSLTATNRRP